MKAIARITCAIKGHRWSFVSGFYHDGARFPSIDKYSCGRCGETKADIFFGGI